MKSNYKKLGMFIRNFLTVAGFIFAGLSLSLFRYPNSFSWVNFCFKILIVFIYIGVFIASNHQQILPLIHRFLKNRKKA